MEQAKQALELCREYFNDLMQDDHHSKINIEMVALPQIEKALKALNTE